MQTPKPRTSGRPGYRTLLTAGLCALLAACGGGGSSGSANPPAPPPPAAPPSGAQLQAASLLASQATFGLTYEGIFDLAERGPEAWLNDQFQQPPSRLAPLVEDLVQRRDAGEFAQVETDIELLIRFRRYAWWHRALSAPDQLRQRVAYALSQIFVVSDNLDIFQVRPFALTNYADMLLEHSFGSFRELLRDVALHPAMGIYLSHLNNRKADPVNNTFPDENFAREVMQLFSIGLFELNIDGSRQLDGNGNPIATYDNGDIREFAKIFTGLSFGGPGATFGSQQPNFLDPMQMFDAFHEPGPKILLRGATVPGGQTGLQDVEAAIDNLFNHPNVGPFIGRQLIQRLVTSNPSPDYVRRIAETFNDDGTGVRGNLQAVIRAILLDPEAGASSSAGAGKLREPVLRYIAMVRQLYPESDDGLLFNDGYVVQFLLQQHPYAAPNVFNFYLPDHTPAGLLADAGLVAPEFQITNSNTIAAAANLVDLVVLAEDPTQVTAPFADTRLNFEPYETLAGDVDALLDRLDLVFTHGRMNPDTRALIRDLIAPIDDPAFRTRAALYMVLVSPDYAVQS